MLLDSWHNHRAGDSGVRIPVAIYGAFSGTMMREPMTAAAVSKDTEIEERQWHHINDQIEDG